MAFGSKDSGETPVTPECQNNSDCAADEICQNGHCVVKPIPTDPCEDVECFNGGTCDGGSCDCVNGYTGTNCEIEPDCNGSKPCTSPKQCENYICVCPKIANCKTLNNSTCECNKCEDGFEVVDGKCVEVSRCAADAPVQCGTSCCPENSTCDGDKCCLGGTCCDAGLAPTACYDLTKEAEDHGISRTLSYFCTGQTRSYDEACQIAKSNYKTYGTELPVETGLFRGSNNVQYKLVSSSDGETCYDAGTSQHAFCYGKND